VLDGAVIEDARVTGLKVAAVTRDQALRLELARAFDGPPLVVGDAARVAAERRGRGRIRARRRGARRSRLRSRGSAHGRRRGGCSCAERAVGPHPGGRRQRRNGKHHSRAALGGRLGSIVAHLRGRGGGQGWDHLQARPRRRSRQLGRCWFRSPPARSCDPACRGFRALLAPRAPASGQLAAVVESAQEEFPTVVVDAPFCCAWPLFPEGVGTGVVVMSPTPTSARRTKDFLDARSGSSWAIVANRLGPGGETTRTELERMLARRIALELPCTPALRDAEDEGRLLRSSWTRYARAVTKLARALTPA
jgi:hypothetical protein